jgi:predicted O-methyltransferase YrrM
MAASRPIDRVHELYPTLKHMNLVQAERMRSIIRDAHCHDILEIGTASGKGTAFLAAILEEFYRGKVCTLDRDSCLRRRNNVHSIARSLGLSHRIEVRLHPRSFTTTLMQMIEEVPRPQFDLVYLDGGKTWDTAGLVFFLADKLLRPGGILVMDDLDYIIGNDPQRVREYPDLTDEERSTAQLRKVWTLLVRERYEDCYELPDIGWGVAHKPRSPKAERVSEGPRRGALAALAAAIKGR